MAANCFTQTKTAVFYFSKKTHKKNKELYKINSFKEKASPPAITKDEKLCNNSL